MKTEKQKCKDKVQDKFQDCMDDIRQMFYAEDNTVEDIGCLFDYGLGIDLVEAGTFEDQREDYIRYQICWGGPAEEFRVYRNGDIEFWYLDWFDGASVDVEGEDADIIKEIVSWSFPDFIR